MRLRERSIRQTADSNRHRIAGRRCRHRRRTAGDAHPPRSNRLHDARHQQYSRNGRQPYCSYRTKVSLSPSTQRAAVASALSTAAEAAPGEYHSAIQPYPSVDGNGWEVFDLISDKLFRYDLHGNHLGTIDTLGIERDFPCPAATGADLHTQRMGKS